MSPSELQFAAALAAERAGLMVRADRAQVAEARLAPIARKLGLAGVPELIEAARGDADGPAAAALVEALASSDTAFFRDRQVFDALAADLAPMLSRRRGGQPVRIWSVGCGAGQEVYSLAMALAEAERSDLPVQLFASDMSDRALQKARVGAYTHFEVQRGLPVRHLLRWFEKESDTWRVSPQLRQTVRWARVNLVDDLSRLGPFDMILCRNVLSGFTPAAAAATLDKLQAILAPDGVLVTGAGESPALGAEFKGAGGVFLRDASAALRAA